MEKVSVLLVGIVVLRAISTVITPPSVSTPRLEGRSVEHENVLHIALGDRPLNGRANGDHFIGIDASVRLFAFEQILHELLHHRHAGRSANQHDFIDLLWVQLASFNASITGLRHFSTSGVIELLELRAGQRHLQVLGTV